MITMKHALPLLALIAALAPVRADEPTAFAVSLPALFAQARPDENRDRNNQRPSEFRPPGAPNPPPPPGGRGDAFGSGGGGGSSGGGSKSGSSSSSFGGSGGGSFSSGSGGQNRMMRLDSRGRSARPVVVTSKPLDAKELAAVEEDLGIMARLLEKEIDREAGAGSPRDAMGIPIVTRLDGRSSVMLLEGYGAVFTFTSGMRLTPPPARPAEKKTDRPTDSPWERTRREMFGPSGGGEREGNPVGRIEIKTPAGVAGIRGSSVFEGGERWVSRREDVHYDAKKVEELQKSILEALKQAGNIRALKADDYLTVVVQGSGGGGGGMEIMVETRTETSSSSNGGPPRVETFVNREGGDGSRSGTLTIRAKKSDAEDFAKGNLTAEQFSKKALVEVR